MVSVNEFFESLEKPVDELVDVELAELGEDSRALWVRSEQSEPKRRGVEEKYRLAAAQELEDRRYGGKKVSSKAIFTGDDMSDLAKHRRDASPAPDEDTEAENSEDNGSGSSTIASSSDQEAPVDRDASGGRFENQGILDEESETHKRSLRQSKWQKGMEQTSKENISISKGTVDADESLVTFSSDSQRLKAESVRKQLTIWDRLTQLLILSHAALRMFNQLPREQFAKQLQQSADDDTIKNCKIMRKNLQKLNGIYGELEDALLKSSKQTKDVLAGRENVKEAGDSEDEGIESSDDEEHDYIDEEPIAAHIEDDDQNIVGESEVVSRRKQLLDKRKIIIPMTAEECTKRHERFAPFRSSTLSKWEERTTLTGVCAVKIKKRDFSGFESAALKQIEQIMSEKHRLLRRTQTKRYDADRMGTAENSNYDEEIFDDDDFYQQLLKELIEKKAASAVDPIKMSRQWLEIQNLRQKRSKRKKVDTKASKGRKIRYAVIPKLVNYFPSIADNAKWNQESRNQLFKSLFVP